MNELFDNTACGFNYHFLIEKFIILMDKIEHQSTTSSGIYILFTHDYICLSIRGNSDIKQKLANKGYIVGRYWPPELLGINETNKIQLEKKQSIYLSSKAINKSKSGTLGYITYGCENINSYEHIESNLILTTEYLADIDNHIKSQTTDFNRLFIDTSKTNFLVLDREGLIVHSSNSLLEQLDIESCSEITNKNIFEKFIFPPKIKHLISDGDYICDENIYFDFSGKVKNYNLTMFKITQGYRILAFSTLTLPGAESGEKHRINFTLEHFKTESPKMKRIISTAQECINNTSPIYIIGEEGTGKRSLAHAIHNSCSHFSQGPFVAVNLHSVKKEELSDLLFGDGEKKQSKFELANGGTLYIERIDLLPGVLQAALTHIMLTNTIFHFSTKKSINLSFRLITSSIRPLEEFVHEKRFCPSLYYYLTGASLNLPNLMNRAEDIPLIVNEKLESLSNGNTVIDPFLRQHILEYAQKRIWVGNLSELTKWIEHAFLHRDEVFTESAPADTSTLAINQIKPLDLIEKREIANALSLLNRKYVSVAEQLGISLSTLRRKIEKYEL